MASVLGTFLLEKTWPFYLWRCHEGAHVFCVHFPPSVRENTRAGDGFWIGTSRKKPLYHSPLTSMCRRREPIFLTFRPTVKSASLFLPPLQNCTNYADQEDDIILLSATFWSYSLCQVSPRRTTGIVWRKQTETSDGCLAGNRH